MTRRMRRSAVGRWLRKARPALSVVALVWGLVTALPLLWMFVSSFKTFADFTKNLWGLPTNWTIDNYISVWTGQVIEGPITQVIPLSSFVINSVIVTVGSLAITLAIAIPASYVLARTTVRGRNFVLFAFLVMLAVPVQALIIPIWNAHNQLNLINTYPGLILPYVGTAMPFAVLLLTSYFRGFPKELEEAGRLDGLGTVGVVVRVVVPLSKGPISAIGILLAFGFWNEFLFPLLLVPSQDMQTLPLGVVQFMASYNPPTILILTALCILTAPMLIVYVLFQRYITSAQFQLAK